MKEYVMEAYCFFGIDKEVVIESAINTIKQKVDIVIEKIKKLIAKFIDWLKNIFKKKINKLEMDVKSDKEIKLQRQFAKESFDIIYRSKNFIQTPFNFIKILDIKDNKDNEINKVNDYVSEIKERIFSINNIISKNYGDSDYVDINISKVKDLYNTFEGLINSNQKMIEQFGSEIDIYNYIDDSKFDEERMNMKNAEILFVNLKINCLNYRIELMVAIQKLINHILSNIK